MLHELDDALRALVERDLGGSTEVDIEFDAPTKDWASHRNRPTIDLYLYDIRQDTSRNHVGDIWVQRDDGTVSGRQPQPKWFRLSYLVTAWTQRAEDEHRLLSALLTTFLRNETLPEELVTGSLADSGASIAVAVAMPPPQDRSLSDVWSALGGELKPSLDVLITAPLIPDRTDEVGPPVTEEPGLRIRDRHTGAEEEIGLRPVPEDRLPRDGADRRPPPPRRTRTRATKPKKASAKSKKRS